MDFPVDNKGQVSADVLFAEFMNALRRMIGHSEVENSLVLGLGRSGAGDIARSHERSARIRIVVVSFRLTDLLESVCISVAALISMAGHDALAS